MSIYKVENLRIELATGQPIVEEFTLSVNAGEVVAIVGESGSGKTTAGLAMLGFARDGLKIAKARYEVGGIRTKDPEALAPLRGKLLSYVPQDPATALNPSMRIGRQVEVILKTHAPELLSTGRVGDIFDLVQLPSDPAFLRRYPHQLSGGQQQRVAIAMGLACDPSLVVFDEPTTGLDVITQSELLRQIQRIRERTSLAMIYVTHDLSVVAEIADRVVVMYAGKVIEAGPVTEVLRHPAHPYTAGLLAATPDYARPRVLNGIAGTTTAADRQTKGCQFASRCSMCDAGCLTAMPPVDIHGPDHEVRCFHAGKTEVPTGRALDRALYRSSETPALELKAIYAGYNGGPAVCSNVNLRLMRGECLAIVGQSGSGKSTLSRVMAGLHTPDTGAIELFGKGLPLDGARRTQDMRRDIQLIFQNPKESLNPRHTIGHSIARSTRLLHGSTASEAAVKTAEMLDLVRLDQEIAGRYPYELSGGQLQRAAIARALVANPKLLICDEVTSALDVSVQAAVIELLTDLREKMGLSLIFVTHDLGVVASIAQRVLVFDRGHVIEAGDTQSVLDTPRESYTQMLLGAASSLSENMEKFGATA